MIKISAIVSTHNSEKFIKTCLEDLLNQTLFEKGTLEIIVIDSNSEQDEGAIVKDFQQKYPNIQYVRTETRESVYAAWNRGIEIARGEYVTNANTDDAHRKDALELLAEALDTNPEADLAYAHNAWTNYPNDTFEDSHAYLEAIYPPYDPSITMLYCLLGAHPLWRKSVFDKIGLFDPSFEAVGDYDFLFRFVKAKLSAVLVPEVLSLFYVNPEGLSRAAGRSEKEISQLREKYEKEIPIDCLYKIDIKDKQSVAYAWIAQGILASRIIVPWENYDLANLPYAAFCFRKAIEADSSDLIAIQNLIAVRSRMQDWQGCELLIGRHERILSGKVKTAVRDRCPVGLMKIKAPPPAVKALVYPDTPPYPFKARPSFIVEYGFGFYDDEGNYRWMCKSGEVTISPDVLKKPVMVIFILSCGEAGYYDAFPFSVDVLLGDQHIGKVNFDASRQKRIVNMRIQPSLDEITIQLVSNGSFVPSQRTGINDNRILSVSLGNLMIQPKKNVELFNGEIYLEGRSITDSTSLLPQFWTQELLVELTTGVAGYGFYEREGSGYFWMSRAGKIEISSKMLKSPVHISFDLTCGEAKNYDGFPFEVLIFFEDEPANQILFQHSGQTNSLRFPIKASTSNATIILKSSESFIPAQKKINEDKRQLSIQLSNLQIS